MFDAAVPGLIILAILIAFALHDLMWGPLAALTAECFTPPALQRSLDRLSACSGVRRRPGTNDRDGDPRRDRLGPGDRVLHLCVRDRQHRCDGLIAEHQGPRFRPRPPLIAE
jgi:hypothetical protein